MGITYRGIRFKKIKNNVITGFYIILINNRIVTNKEL